MPRSFWAKILHLAFRTSFNIIFKELESFNLEIKTMIKKILFLTLLLLGGFLYYFKDDFGPKDVLVFKEITVKPLILTFIKVKGDITFSKEGQSQKVVEGQVVDSAGTIKTLDKSFAILAYGKGFTSKIIIGSNTQLDLSKFEINLPRQKEGVELKLNTGNILLKIFNPDKKTVLKVKTNFITMGIRGTTFYVKSNLDESLLLVKEGAVEMESDEVRNATFVYGDNGYSANSKGTTPVKLTDYKIDWDNEIEEQNVEKITTSDQFRNVVEKSLDDMKKQLETMDAKISGKKTQLESYEALDASELVDMKKDLHCLDDSLGHCDLVSKIFSNNILYKRSETKNFFSKEVKQTAKQEIEKHKIFLNKRTSSLKLDIEESEKTLLEHESKYKFVHGKLAELDSMDESKKAEAKKSIYRDIVDTLDERGLKEEFIKILTKK
jgi:hypothetical protein